MKIYNTVISNANAVSQVEIFELRFIVSNLVNPDLPLNSLRTAEQ